MQICVNSNIALQIYELEDVLLVKPEVFCSFLFFDPPYSLFLFLQIPLLLHLFYCKFFCLILLLLFLSDFSLSPTAIAASAVPIIFHPPLLLCNPFSFLSYHFHVIFSLSLYFSSLSFYPFHPFLFSAL